MSDWYLFVMRAIFFLSSRLQSSEFEYSRILWMSVASNLKGISSACSDLHESLIELLLWMCSSAFSASNVFPIPDGP